MKKRLRKKQGNRKKLTYVLITASILGILGYSILYSPQQPTDNINQTPFKAAIVDHLSIRNPNQTFNEKATAILTEAGYIVDYYPGEEVTVEFYRNLPQDYGLMILRVHSSATWTGGAEYAPTLFTSERASETKYVYEQLTDQLLWVSYTKEERERGILYFGIGPLFVWNATNGRFQDTIIIMMGCEGMKNEYMAEAFVERGAKVYISWDEEVLDSHTDSATIILLQHLITQNQTIEESVANTMEEVGPDPKYKSILLYYPEEAQDYSISFNCLIVNVAETKTWDFKGRKRDYS